MTTIDTHQDNNKTAAVIAALESVPCRNPATDSLVGMVREVFPTLERVIKDRRRDRRAICQALGLPCKTAAEFSRSMNVLRVTIARVRRERAGSEASTSA